MTPEQILSLSSNESTRKNALKLVGISAWRTLHADERTAWGEIQGSGAAPYQVRFDLHDSAYKCSCPSHQQPCKHVLALMLLYAQEAAAFHQEEPPRWVTAWIAARAAKATTKKTNSEVGDPEAQAKRASEREAKVNAGIDALDLWLRDLVRGGFDGLPGRGTAFWEAPAARMVDAQARGLANQLLEMGKIPQAGAGWASQLLERAGMLYLLTEAYRHQADLPPTLRADVRALVGWAQKQDDLRDLPAARDHWVVLSQRVYEEERAEIQRTWLRGLTSGQSALLLDFSFNNQPFELKLPAGTCFDGDLTYYPSHYPQRVLLKQRRRTLPPVNIVEAVSAQTIPQAAADYAQALSRQPWLSLFPMLLQDVYPLRNESGWMLRDADGHFLPLGAYVDAGWTLLALSGGHPLTVFGEWNGERFLQRTAWAGQRMVLL